MKLRMNNTSIRVRISQTEVETLKNFDSLHMVIDFPGDTRFTCSLVPSKSDEFDCRFSSGVISIFIPESVISSWGSSGTIEMESNVRIENDKELLILVEKDFKRLSNRVREDESDLYPHPKGK